MAANEIHIGDTGTELTVHITDNGTDVDISTADPLVILLRKPSGEVLEKEAALVSGGTTGRMKYATEAADFDEVGMWEIQGRVTIGTGVWSSEVARFRVHQNADR